MILGKYTAVYSQSDTMGCAELKSTHLLKKLTTNSQKLDLKCSTAAC
jgi:hypothetical protein